MQNFYDIIRKNSELWDIFTRKEEYTSTVFDHYDRFQSSQSTFRELLNPIVSDHLVKNGFGIEYPENRPFCVCLTHDVDEIYPPLRHTLLSSLNCCRNLDFKGLNRQLLWKLSDKKNSPYRDFKRIIETEENYDAQSSFYFLATDTDILRFRYNIEDLGVELGEITDKGCEVGLHGGFYSYNNLDGIMQEKLRLEEVLGDKVTGFRNHYLRFRVPDSWTMLAKAGFAYDSTLAYPEAMGFRNGMCHPFFPYNLNTETAENILELPLAIMDSTLFPTSSTPEDAWHNAQRCIDIVESYRGVLVINWHSNTFNCPYKKQWQKMYEKILDYCNKKNAWMSNGQKISGFLKTTSTWYSSSQKIT